MAAEIFEHNPDVDMRIEGATLLGLLMQKTRDIKTLRLLYPYVYDENVDFAISESAAKAISEIYAGDFGEALVYIGVRKQNNGTTS